MKHYSRTLSLVLAAMAFALILPLHSLADDKAKMDKFIQDLMSRMTLHEKIGQMNLLDYGSAVTGLGGDSTSVAGLKDGEVGALLNVYGAQKTLDIQKQAVKQSRLHIPLFFGFDVVHGYRTVFPIPLALAATWDTLAVEKSARIAATEAAAAGIGWVYSPMVDIARDPRWGRVAEGAGEDPVLGCAIARSMVRGFQGKSLKDKDAVMACVKHFALYGAAEAGREYNTVDMSPVRMFNEYLAPYRAAVNAGVGSVMTSFNEINGVPATGNKWLLTDLLRNQWGFDGFVVTDYNAMGEMVNHGLGDTKYTAELSLKSGVDQDMCTKGFIKYLEELLKEGKVSMKEIDTACRRVLEAKYKLGLFDDPYKYHNPKVEAKVLYNAEFRQTAREIAAESFVLLKNQNNLLPLNKDKKILLCGPLANWGPEYVGCWCGAPKKEDIQTLKSAFEEAMGTQGKILYAQGANIMEDATLQAAVRGKDIPRGDDEALLREALEKAKQADVIVAALGECANQTGESASMTDLGLAAPQRRLLEELLKTGKPVVLLHLSGRPNILTWEDQNVPAILQVWFAGTEMAPAVADVVFGKTNPSGKITMTFPKALGQVPIYYNCKTTGRPPKHNYYKKYYSNYIDVDNYPLYPFGYGLSYTTFQYSPVTLSSNEMNGNGELTAQVTVTNTGKRDGIEIVQCYVRDIVRSITPPRKELKDFRRIALKAGESQTLQFRITPEMLKFYNEQLQYGFEPGKFEVQIGPNSRDVQKANFKLAL